MTPYERRCVQVIEASADALPLADASFDLVTSRHPVRPDWKEIHRVLRPAGSYVAQHVGPASAFELIESFPVWILRKCVWWVPDFTVTRYQKVLRDLDRGMRPGHPVVAHSARHLIRAHREP